MRCTILSVDKELVIALPEDFVQQNGLREGGRVAVECSGNVLTVEAQRPRYKLADLLAEMPDGLPRVEGFDEMPSVGRER